VLVIAACGLWGLDNNLTQRVSLRDARHIVAIKGLAGGITSLSLAAAFGGFGHWTALRFVAAVIVGAVSFGLSIALFVRGLRRLGVIQTGMLFALAPGFAAILSLLFLRETLAVYGLVALASMTTGALLLATDRHEHMHEHEAMEHAHEHVHDEHHQHGHTPEQLAQTPHAHWHRHAPLIHRHPHVHDIHHRHRH
jgi:drug/metabolite transporter (DMT)-like permease